ncbi:hypothetical protein BD779DRAFT_1597897 [Infundibulicybe gibba]|nr:hypothetical protein BD779DRAFT_1597897 [Infundibulicybe gibba]
MFGVDEAILIAFLALDVEFLGSVAGFRKDKLAISSYRCLEITLSVSNLFDDVGVRWLAAEFENELARLEGLPPDYLESDMAPLLRGGIPLPDAVGVVVVVPECGDGEGLEVGSAQIRAGGDGAGRCEAQHGQGCDESECGGEHGKNKGKG